MLRFHIILILILIIWANHAFSYQIKFSRCSTQQKIAFPDIHFESFSRLFVRSSTQKSDDSSLRMETTNLSKNYLCNLNDDQFAWVTSFVEEGFQIKGRTLKDVLSALKENSESKSQLTETMKENKESLQMVAKQINDISDSLKSIDKENIAIKAGMTDSLAGGGGEKIIS